MSDHGDDLRPAAETEGRDLVPDPAALQQLADPGHLSRQRHPPGLFLLFAVEMWERFSYYGMRAILVLYLVQAMSGAEAAGNPGRGWQKVHATRLVGWYGGLAFLLPLVGGFFADKFLGTHRSMLTGGVLIALGHIVLGITGLGDLNSSDVGMSVFVGGLALIIMGTGYFKPCVTVMVGQLYPTDDPRRDGAFTIFYMGINVGAMLSPLVCGYLGEEIGWHWGFGAAAVGMLAGLLTYMIGRPKLLRGVGLPPEGRSNSAPFFFVASLFIAAGVALLYHVGFFGWIGRSVVTVLSNPNFGLALRLILLAVALGGVIWFIAIQKPGDKGPTASIFIFTAFTAFFWFAFEQAASSLNLFAKESTERHVFGWEVPASWLQSAEPLFIVLLGPLVAAFWTALARRKADPSQPAKIGLGLFFIAGGYAFMVIAGRSSADGIKVGMIWLIVNYFFHALGEFFVSPTGLAYVTKAAPVRFVSLLIGVFYISNFLANVLAGYVAGYVEQIEKGEMQLFWYRWFKLGGQADFFLLFVLTSFGAGLTILVFTPLLKKLLPRGQRNVGVDDPV